MTDILVVCCTRQKKETSRLYQSLTRLGFSESCFVENNRAGLPASYNPFLEQYAGQDLILAFVHDDVEINDLFLREKLLNAADNFAVSGLVGSSHFAFQRDAEYFTWCDLPAEHLSGAVEQTVPSGQSYWSSYGPVPHGCLVLDGLFLAVDMRRIGPVRFDERFTFNWYDLDFCLSCHKADLVLGTTNIYAHPSQGDAASMSCIRREELFWEKWTGRV